MSYIARGRGQRGFYGDQEIDQIIHTQYRIQQMRKKKGGRGGEGEGGKERSHVQYIISSHKEGGGSSHDNR